MATLCTASYHSVKTVTMTVADNLRARPCRSTIASEREHWLSRSPAARPSPLYPLRCQVGASFRNKDVVVTTQLSLAAAQEARSWYVVDPDHPARKSWAVLTSLLLLYTLFMVRERSIV